MHVENDGESEGERESTWRLEGILHVIEKSDKNEVMGHGHARRNPL